MNESEENLRVLNKLPWAERPVWRSIDCGDGWLPLVEDLNNRLLEIAPDYEVIQVKEKFGGLRYYIGPVSPRVFDEVYGVIRAVEEVAAKTCEWCGMGSATVDKNSSWIKTLCDPCKEKRKELREFPRGVDTQSS